MNQYRNDRSTPAAACYETRFRLSPLTQALLAVGWLAAVSPTTVVGQPLPTGMVVRAGQAQATVQGAQMTVRNSANTILDWQKFDIASGHRVHFDQASAQSKVLNRVTGSDPSQIFGSLSSNGQVWLLNPNGVLFGRDAQVDVAGLVASTLRLNDNDFLAGRYRFGSPGAGLVQNQGNIRTSLGGQVAFIGGRIENQGSIEAPNGTITLAGGQSVELVDTGAPNLAARIDVPTGEVLNLGTLTSPNGVVDVFAGVVNQQGVVRADSLQTDASGNVVLRASNALTLGAQSVTSANGPQGGSIRLDSGAGTLAVMGQVQATGSQQKGGRVWAEGRDIALQDGSTVDASGSSGGGEILIGGGLQGQDARLKNAQTLTFAPLATVAADARDRGDGGNVVFWSDKATRAHGSISARGGANSGDGGFVETSGGWLDARPRSVRVDGPKGKAGSWLLDPNDINIYEFPPNTNISSDFQSTGDSSNIRPSIIEAALNSGANVNIRTSTAGANSQFGDIRLIGGINVTPASAVTLTLSAHRDINLGQASSIISTGAPLNINLVSAISGNVGSISLEGATINTNGGSLSMGGGVASQARIPGNLFSLPLSAARGVDRSAISITQSQILLGLGRFSAIGRSEGLGSGVDIRNSNISTSNFVASGFSESLSAGVLLLNSQIISNSGYRVVGHSLAGPGVDVQQSRLTSSGDILIQGGSSSPNYSVRLQGATRITGRIVELDVASGSGIELENGSSSSISAPSGMIVLDAYYGSQSQQLRDRSSIRISGDWQLSASEVQLSADSNLSLSSEIVGGLSLAPRFVAPKVLIEYEFTGARIGVNNGWRTAFSQMPPGSNLTFRSRNFGSPVYIDGPLDTPASIRVLLTDSGMGSRGVGVLNISTSGALRSTANDSAIIVSAGTFTNQGGANSLQTPNGRWALVLDDLPNSQLGGLSPAFTQYGVNWGEQIIMSSGLPATALPGNALLSRSTVTSLLGNNQFAINAVKTQDGSSGIDLFTSDIAAGRVTVSGLLPGHSLSLQGGGNFLNAAVGENKPITPDASFLWAVVDSRGNPVIGYPTPQLSGSIRASNAATPVARPPVAPPSLPSVPVPVPGGQFPATPGGADSASSVVLASRSVALLSPVAEATRPAQGRALDAVSLVTNPQGTSGFRPLAWTQMSRPEQEALLASRDAFKKRLFSDSLVQLEKNPDLANLKPCKTLQELEAGLCAISDSLKQEMQQARDATQWRQLGQRKVKAAVVPQIARKIAVLVGINAYKDVRIPRLSSAVGDAVAVRDALSGTLGYDTVLLEDADKASIVKTLNRLALEAKPEDSVVIYFAGHGEVVPSTGMGYWLGSDSRADRPESWLSNADISRLVAQISAKQVMLVSDSCYAGTLAGNETVSKSGATDASSPETLLARKAAVVMASGGNEPVADTGRDGHSIFAWHLLQQLKAVPSWQGGGQVFDRVRDAVVREFPQTPRYGAQLQAGHQQGTDYLIERRELETPAR